MLYTRTEDTTANSQQNIPSTSFHLKSSSNSSLIRPATDNILSNFDMSEEK
jgi:hypothetical protein